MQQSESASRSDRVRYEESEHRPGRLRLHGPDAFERVPQAPRFFDLPYRRCSRRSAARNAERVKAFAENWGYESVETDWRKLVDAQGHRRHRHRQPERHAPRDRHRRGEGRQDGDVREAARPERGGGRGDGRGGRDGRRAEHGLVQLPPRARGHAAQAADRRGPLGRIFHYRAKFLQDWTISQDLPQGGEGLWRLDVTVAGSGVTGDLLAHCIDTALWLNGPITEVTAMTETFIKERKHNLTGKVEPVGIDDASAFLCRFENGSLATFEATRYARGHKALYTLEINGEHASAFWDLHDLHRLQYFDHRDEGPRARLAQHPRHRRRPALHEALVGAGPADRLRAHLHPPGRRLRGGAAAEGKGVAPTFRDALQTDYVTDAILASATSGQWERCRRTESRSGFRFRVQGRVQRSRVRFKVRGWEASRTNMEPDLRPERRVPGPWSPIPF